MNQPNCRLCLAVVVFAAVVVMQAEPADRQSAVRVLFIGNSLTAANDLPGMVEAVAAQLDGARSLTCRAVALPDYGLEEHWNDGRALRTIRDGSWTHVVLQQGPSSLESSQTVLRAMAKRFAGAIAPSQARLMFFGVWPPRARLSFQDAVTTSYARAAKDVGGVLVPVGEGWRAAWRRDATLPLYSGDDFHPSPMGSYLGALMFAQRLTGRSPVGAPSPSSSSHRALREVRVDARQLAILQEAAADANDAAAAPR